jgi:hypothetical protein
MTGPIVITLGMVDATGHDNRSVPICIVVVRVSKMTDVVMNTDRCRHRGDHDLVVDMNIDIEIETYRGAGLAASRLTQGGHIALTSAVILLAADLAVPVIVATGTTNEIDAIGLTEIEIPAAGLIRLKSPQPDACVSMGRIAIVCGQIDTVQARTLPVAGSGRLRHLLAIVHRQH